MTKSKWGAGRFAVGGVLAVALCLVTGATLAQNTPFVLADPQSDVYFRFVIAAGAQIQIEENTQTTGNVHSNGEIVIYRIFGCDHLGNYRI